MGQLVAQVRQNYNRWQQSRQWSADDRDAVDRRLQLVRRAHTWPHGKCAIPRWAARGERALTPVESIGIAWVHGSAVRP
jgi:hypothetical protein